jgi:hypothetical protein
LPGIDNKEYNRMKKDSSPIHRILKKYKLDHDYVFESNWKYDNWTLYKCKKCRIECYVNYYGHVFYFNNKEVSNQLSCAEYIIKDIIE